MQQISADFFGPLDNGHYYMVNHCDYSRWASVDEIKTCSWEQVQPVLERLFTTFGAPLVYKTDNGPPFQSSMLKQFAEHWGFVHRLITPFWPRANGEVESFMKKLGKVTRAAATAKKSRNEAVQSFLRTYRETPHSTTGIAPSILLMGFSRSSGIPQFEPEIFKPKELPKIHAKARSNDEQAKLRIKNEYDRRMGAKDSKMEVGDKVLIKYDNKTKYMTHWDPIPYTIVNIKGSMITACRKDKTRTRNSSWFTKFNDTSFDMSRNAQQA